MLGRSILRISIALTLAFLLAPLVICVFLSFNSVASMGFPPSGFSLRWYANFLTRSQFQDATLFSVQLAVCVALTSMVVGTALAIFMVRETSKLSRLASVLVPLPVFVPEVVTGLALLTLLSKLGLGMGFSSLWIAHTIVTIPYTTYTALVSLKSYDTVFSDASTSLGASPLQTLFRVVLPCIKPGISAGAIFAFLLSFDNLVISSFLLSPLNTSLPVQVSMYIRTKSDPTVAAIATLLMISTVIGVALVNRLFGLEKIMRIQNR